MAGATALDEMADDSDGEHEGSGETAEEDRGPTAPGTGRRLPVLSRRRRYGPGGLRRSPVHPGQLLGRTGTCGTAAVGE
ncbi:hypothetical protein AB0C13_17735 [Streptomyces sp. NPDC049099]|uniref:hypothetical protein n=1 Tax=Streptomyces sp. NPDC049099 TaxID=3155768 RepID=UPI00341C6AE9